MSSHDLFRSKLARDRGIALVSSHAPNFMTRGIAFIMDLPPGNYTSEQINERLEAVGIRPHSDKAYGALTRHAARLVLLQDTGQTRQMRKVKSHARRTPVWHRPAW